ncbi:gp53-like domain-containing protein [Herbaspirillum camelliae]|uniref:gp53-like domain-containing protein n=1 Tax=Herbaspirillum camelliae TaxID=1892903 RepID=UPI000A9F7907|nr:hypothetical protein [Herbaspirillum camelliae]
MKRISTSTRMVDKFGPGKSGFTNGNAVTGVAATDLEAAWFDQVQESIVRTIEEAGLELSDVDMDQFVTSLKVVIEKKIITPIIAGGTANALTCTIDSVRTALVDGEPLTVIAKAANTGAVTATLTIGGVALAALPVVKGANTALSPGDIASAGYPMRLCYSAGIGALILLNPANGLGSGGLLASSVATISSSGTLSSSVVGGTVLVNAGASNTQTLPSAAAVGVGRRIEFLNIGAGAATVARAGADGIVTGSASVNSLLLGTGDSLTLESNGVSTWYAVGGSAQLKSAAAFRSLLSGNGYAQLPSGIIIQAGAASVTAGSYTDVTFPIAFPTACMSVIANPGLAGSAQSQYSGAGNVTLTGFQIAMNQGTGVTNRWFAMGY